MTKHMKRLLFLLTTLMGLSCSHDAAEATAQTPAGHLAKTLVVYYSYTGDCRDIVTELTRHIEADVLEIQPTEKGLKYEANGYALGTQLLNAIKANPDDAASYSAIAPVPTSLDGYRNIVIVTHLWWSQMAALMQTYLFHHGPQMADKTIALVVSSASSGISGVVADCKRLVPEATWAGDALWINNQNRSRMGTLVTDWLQTQHFQTSQESLDMYITIDRQTQRATLADNPATQALVEKLQDGPLTLTLSASGGFEIWGPLGFSLPTHDQHVTAQPGDIVLYNGSNICLFYGSNSWSYTPLGKIADLSESELPTFLKAGETHIRVTLSLTSDATALRGIPADQPRDTFYTLGGRRTEHPANGVFIKNGKKVIR